MNGGMAPGCVHVQGGEAPTGTRPGRDAGDPRTDEGSSVRNIPIPVHGTVGGGVVGGLIWVTGGGTSIGGGVGSLHNERCRPAASHE
jgi:hypothetical protein